MPSCINGFHLSSLEISVISEEDLPYFIMPFTMFAIPDLSFSHYSIRRMSPNRITPGYYLASMAFLVSDTLSLSDVETVSSTDKLSECHLALMAFFCILWAILIFHSETFHLSEAILRATFSSFSSPLLETVSKIGKNLPFSP